MFQSMDIANGGSQQVMIRGNQAQQQQQSPQMFAPQYGYQQQPSYFATYSNSSNGGAPSAPNKGGMNFVTQQPSSYVQQQHPVLSYRYTQEVPSSNQYINPVRYQANQDNQRLLTSMGYVTGNSAQEGFQMQPQPQSQQAHQPQQSQQQPTSQRGGRGRGGALNGAHSGNSSYLPYCRQVHNNYFYNQQHHYSSNNAVPEKTPTLHIMNPNTKKITCVKLNRIYTTMADLRPHINAANQQYDTSRDSNIFENNADDSKSNAPLTLCLDFLSLRGCVHGSGCEKVHIAGLEYTWSPIEPSTTVKDGKTMYKAGFRIHCYNSVLSTYYEIPSEFIEVTRGSETYVEMYNEHKDNFKTKIKICGSVLAKEPCKKGCECPNIHCLPDEFTNVQEKNTRITHISRASPMRDVPRLPAGMIVRVFDQNSDKHYHDYTGDNVLLTEGAKNYAKYFERNTQNVSFCKRMQHCAHFKLKEMCRLGASCRFLHVLPTPEEIQEMQEQNALKFSMKDQGDQGQDRFA